ncbi:hypothetical protein FE257_008835 [Aspergillus nanangensis]|uniref:Uncharacterized protein n=1 Tax=Aspergillus nanangensis TaxID=2582783 RepID=A0AAD4GT51_ASPNN|nr:hypothetical protein FE257_008835 [Aspergillus nanangensis]
MSPPILDRATYSSIRTFSSARQHDPDRSTAPASPPTEKDVPFPAEWGVGWRCPTLMVGLFLCGLLLSVGHHLYYNSLDNTVVNSAEQQTWAIRIGTGFAFLVKTFYVAAIGIAAVQQMWTTLRRRSMNLRGIDAMFGVLNNPINFLTPEMWVFASTLSVIATISWLVPLTALVTPATLSVNLLTKPNITRAHVPTVNFTDENFWKSWALFEGVGRIENPSSAISRLFTAVSSSVAVVPFPPPFPNSSYTLEFWGPSYKCQTLDETIAEMKGISFTNGYDRNYSSFEDVWHQLVHNSSDDQTPFSAVYRGSAPGVLNNTLLMYAPGENTASDHPTDKTSLVCQLWNTSYVLGVNNTDGIQTLAPISIDFVAASNWDDTAGNEIFLRNDGPEVNAGFYITHLLFSALISGSLTIGSTGSLVGDGTPLMRSGLFDCPELWNGTYNTIVSVVESDSASYCRNKTLGRALEDLSRNFTYSLLSLNAANTSVPVTVYSPQNFYAYNRKNLFVAYIVAAGVTITCIAVGLFALWDNGVSHNTSFSGVLRTTRNPDLDFLATGYCFGSDELTKEVRRVKLRFGEIETAPQTFKHAAFGYEDSVTDLVKGEKYY